MTYLHELRAPWQPSARARAVLAPHSRASTCCTCPPAHPPPPRSLAGTEASPRRVAVARGVCWSNMLPRGGSAGAGRARGRGAAEQAGGWCWPWVGCWLPVWLGARKLTAAARAGEASEVV